MIDCIKHTDCTTGFCDDGTCKLPMLHDPCDLSNDQCQSSQKCDSTIYRCVSKHSKKHDGSDCSSHNHCPPTKKCEMSSCRYRDSLGSSCDYGWDCKNGLTCQDSRCVKQCDPSGGNRFGCSSSEECVKGMGNLGYCTSKLFKSSSDDSPRDTKSNRDSTSSSFTDFIPQLSITFAVLLIALIVFLSCLRKRKMAKRARITLQAPLPPASPTYATPFGMTPQPMYTTSTPASPIYMTNQAQSYNGPTPSAPPPQYHTEKH